MRWNSKFKNASFFYKGRDERIGTSDHMTPSHVRYQAALRPAKKFSNKVIILMVRVSCYFLANNLPKLVLPLSYANRDADR